jgi:small subunit ribosomal protein S4
MITHGLIKVNGRRVTIPSFLVSVGDKIALAKKDFALYDEIVRPSWIKLGKREKVAEIIALPKRDDVGAVIDERLVVEFYGR